MEKAEKKSDRLNIYLDSRTRRRIKMKAAQEDISISEYCRRILTTHFSEEGSDQVKRLKEAVENARKFQSRVLVGKIFKVSAADLIREVREEGR
ncbi:MAG: hypothetical protein C4576_29980 [Desulfobacteraceae bacterium]|nr:MAG: hypothetical protein C4576_29980 [Desulfobacteraceae bacterium]